MGQCVHLRGAGSGKATTERIILKDRGSDCSVLCGSDWDVQDNSVYNNRMHLHTVYRNRLDVEKHALLCTVHTVCTQIKTPHTLHNT